jgi:RNA polymerase subunit RPABC4/transcription elongation factor Spt4
VTAVSEFRVIYHEPICPECGSFDITSAEVETGDGLTETAHICRACGAAWPLACVTDWTTRVHATNPESVSQPATRR